MLGKLLKHEWKEISVIPCVLSVVLLVLSVISGFSFLGIREGAADVSRFMTIMLWLLFYFALIAVSLGITIYLAVHFYKTMYTDEGYLTHTLPVSGRELLWSKLIPMAAWSLLTMLVVVLAVLIFGGMGMLFAGREGIVDMTVIWEEIHKLIRQMQLMGGSSLTAFIISMVYIMIVGIFNGPMMLAASIAIGQLALITVENPNGLEKTNGYYYDIGPNAGTIEHIKANGGAAGKIRGNYLEMANVDLANEFSQMITTQRGYQANSKIITVTDQMLEELVNMKR